MLLSELVAVSNRVAGESARKEKVRILADVVAEFHPTELAIGVSYLSGVVPQGSFGVGYASLQALPAPAATSSLTLAQVDASLSAIAAIAGESSLTTRREKLSELYRQATANEQAFLSALLVGGIRQGASEGTMMDAIGKASGVPAKLIRRAVMFTGDAGEVALMARSGGPDLVAGVGLRLFRPVQPMLAKTAPSVASALAKTGLAAIEQKIDGARIQVHREGDVVRVYTRNSNDVTARVPEVVAATLALRAGSLVLDGEAIALRDDGAPSPFQVTMSRFGTETEAHPVTLTPFFFDLLHHDGVDTFDLPLAERLDILDRVVPAENRVPRVITGDAEAGEAFFAATVEAGHEGVMVKGLDTQYEAGRRGPGWLKVKPVHTLDLVVLAVEWGSGRRKGWLSNIHLGARSGDEFVMVGKTFKGMTDAMLEWQTKRFLELETHREGHVVFVRPEQVVEIALDGAQRSSRYPGRVALRFARVRGYRDDKGPEEADTLDTVHRFLSW